MRLIRPRLAVRLAVLVMGLGVGLPAAPATAATQHSTRSRTAAGHHSTATHKSAYSSRASTARRARLARARAVTRARERARLSALREAMTPHYKLDANGILVPDVRAAAAIVFNPATGQVLYEENSQDKRSIASITKVMTALVFLEDNPDLNQDITVQRSDVYAASTTHLRARDELTAGELLHLLLIASDNAAARALARSSHGGTAPFVERMNEKALELGLDSTSFADPSGLNPDNVSSAYDLSRLITFAASDERISSIMRTPTYTVTTTRRTIPIHSTNHLLLAGDVDVMGGKTGFISKAGYCLATLLRLPQGNPVAVVVLGARSNMGRFWETRHLFNWLADKGFDVVSRQESK
ncbi:MAG TPA: serine hydrolase [Vicinamibacterales bacterium]|nr:serine hydrolase [Vicinamibacterales bacterium]